MNQSQLTGQVSERICSHMNRDHKEALKKFALHYGHIQAIKEVEMISITPNKMTLKVNKELIEIPFDHTIASSEEAHKTLVGMLKTIDK